MLGLIAATYRNALPAVRDWMEQTLEQYRDEATPIADLSLARLCAAFPEDLLHRAKVVTVPPGQVPFPPLQTLLSLPETLVLGGMPIQGATYRDTFFVSQEDRADLPESLYFHELVHVVQWERLGVDRFLWAYGMGLLLHGYKNSPLEQMAFSLQAQFDASTLPDSVVSFIEDQTDQSWADLPDFAQDLYQRGGFP